MLVCLAAIQGDYKLEWMLLLAVVVVLYYLVVIWKKLKWENVLSYMSENFPFVVYDASSIFILYTYDI